MRLLKPITIAGILLLAQLTAFGAELAVLRNGFSIRFERKEQNGNLTRLYTGTGYMDIASDQIASFEAEEAPVAPQPQPAAVVQPAAVPSTQPGAIQSSVPASAAINQATPAKAASNVDLDQVVREASNKNRLDPDFVNSVIKAESNFKTHAISRKGAQGLMQLMPGTAAQLGVADPFDPKANVEAGTAHLSALLDQYHDDPIKALAAYNAGAHRVKQYNGVPPYEETRAYIAKIVRDFNAKKRAQMKAAAAAKGNVAVKPAAAPAKAVNSKSPKKTKPQQAGIAKPANPA
jgi:soluble lytic murein transglycosylase-like protein